MKIKKKSTTVKRTLIIPASALVLSTLVGCSGSDPTMKYIYGSKEACLKDYLEKDCKVSPEVASLIQGPGIPQSILNKTSLTADQKYLLGKTTQSSKVPAEVLFVEREGQLFKNDPVKGLVALTDEEMKLAQYEYKTKEECEAEWNKENCKEVKTTEGGTSKSTYHSNPILTYFLISRMMSPSERSFASSHLSSGTAARVSTGTPLQSSFKGTSVSHSSSKSISRGGFGRSYGGGRSFGG